MGLLSEGRLLLSDEMETLRARFRRIRLTAGEGAPADLRSALPEFEILSLARLGTAAEVLVEGEAPLPVAEEAADPPDVNKYFYSSATSRSSAPDTSVICQASVVRHGAVALTTATVSGTSSL